MSEYTSYLRFLVEVWHHKVVEQAEVDCAQSVSRKDWANDDFWEIPECFFLYYYIKV